MSRWEQMRNMLVVTFIRYRWANDEPWPYRRDVWTRRNPYPTPLWVRLLNHRKPPWAFINKTDIGFYRRGSPTLRRYQEWSRKRGHDIVEQARARAAR